MVDDLTETAGTLTQAAALLKKQGRQEDFGLCFPRDFERNRASNDCENRILTN